MGVSLVEVLIVLAMVGILSTLALVQLAGARTDFQRQNIVREFKNYLERARFDSVKRRPSSDDQKSTVTLTSSTTISVKLDFNGDGTISSAETRSIDFTQRSNTRIYVTDTLNYPVNIRFNRRGQAEAIDYLGNSVTPVFRICSDCSSSTPEVSYIAVSASGTISDSDAAPSTLPTPAVSNVTNPSLSCYVLVSNTNSGCNLF
jgi:Tfp pilus assembly protein FimT